MSRPTDYRLGLALVTAATLAWSTAGLFTRIIPLDAASLLVWRGVFGALGLAAVVILFEGWRGLSGFGRLGRAGCLYAIVSAAGMLCFITSFRHTTVAHVSIVYATVPFVVAALAWLLLRERPTARALLASLAALAGVVVMVGWSTEGGLVGDLLAFGMTVCLAIMMIVSRGNPDMPVTAAAAWSALLSAAVAVPFAATLQVTPHELGLLAAFGLVNSALGLGLFTLGARHLPAVETALITTLEAPVAPLWVWLAFAETPGTATLAGGAIVLVAVTWHVVGEARMQAAVAEPVAGG